MAEGQTKRRHGLGNPAAASAGSAIEIRAALPAGVSAENPARVEIPAVNLTPGTVAVLVRPDGTEEIIKTSMISENGIVLTLDGPATVKIVDNTKSFADVTGSEWYAGSVAWATSREIMNGMGDGLFNANADASRAQIAQILMNLDGTAPSGGTAVFADVGEDSWFADAVTWLVECGIAQGQGASFGANDPITREDIAVILYRYAKYKGYDTSARGDVSGFPDAGDIDDYARDALAWAVGAGLINGSVDENGNVILDPSGSVTRAQFAAIMQRFVENVVK